MKKTKTVTEKFAITETEKLQRKFKLKLKLKNYVT